MSYNNTWGYLKQLTEEAHTALSRSSKDNGCGCLIISICTTPSDMNVKVAQKNQIKVITFH